MIRIGQYANWVAGALVGIVALLAHPAAAQGTGRVPVPPDGVAAFDAGDYGKAAGIIIPAFEACRAAPSQGAACTDLAKAVALLVAVAGNAKTEPTILAAQDYIDTRVGRETEDALGMLNLLSSYYDRVLDMAKFGAVAERRYALARKLHGPVGRPTVLAAVSLCVVQWNLGKGQAAIDLMTPLQGKLPERTPAEMELVGRVYDCTGTAYYSMDQNREAEIAFRRALALFERAEGQQGGKAIDVLASLANTLRRLRRDGEALALAKRVEGLAKPGSEVLSRIDWARAPTSDPLEAARAEFAQTEARYGAKSPVTDMAGASYGIALIEAGRFAEAEPYIARLEAAAGNPSIPASVRIKLLIGRIAMITTQD
ncbi:MAG: tetratricopeptide repeat protein, partial [Tsuneonella sp.]